jgi:hypothetical protein
MNANTEVATTKSQTLAELAAAELAAEITSEDLALPRLYVGQPGSEQVQNDRVPLGSLYLAVDKDDPEPVAVYQQGGPGLLIHMLAMKKVWCFTDEGGSFRVVAESTPGLTADYDYQRGYQMILCLPTFDRELPVSALFKSTAIPTGKKIITAITKSKAAPWESAFELTTVPRSNQKGRWHMPVAATVKPVAKNVKAAAELAELIGVGRPRPEIAAESNTEDDSIPY